ncbi:hypothetical protein QE152_g1071 [Popillia japonica]|uniref:FAM234A/B beta-propeller domain-containing protein n=1 Tax=Popillia japonica TaxID=7064 RepID=A0AAW1N852_POPJA
MSDVEDEVFIRDGKNGYKFAEDVGVKRPLMAPRRKLTKSDFGSRIKNRPMCWSLCRPCCYVFSGLILLIGLIALVVILVSLFPLPIDKLKNWFISKTRECFTEKLLPCSELVVTDVWTVSLPKLTSESAVRILDVTSDGIDDVIFGYGTGGNYDINPDIFCKMFFNIEPPCGGGLIALNGSNGEILWRRWLPHSVFIIYCTVDVNGDGTPDCLVTGKAGIFCMIDSRNGSIIWEFDNKFTPDQPLIIDSYMANYILDQDNDGVDDILTAHTSQTDIAKTGHLILVSGRTGEEIKRVETTPNLETFYLPQLLYNERDVYVIFGTGSPTSGGNLSVVPLHEVAQGYLENVTTLFQDQSKGVMSPAVLVDITGDNITDIIISLFNSTTLAIDGSTFKQIWNFTVPNSETLSIPTPGYFNEDNVTDFFIKYQTGSGFPVYYYSQGYIIDGRTGNPIYSTPIVDSVGSQMGGLTLSMENRGLDWFLFWTADCRNYEGHQDMYEFISGSTTKQQNHADICKLRFNSSMFTKLNALNQYDQPPGLQIYNSDQRLFLEYNNSRTPLEEAKEYLTLHPEFAAQHLLVTPPVDTTYKAKTEPMNVKHKTDVPNYRHKATQAIDDEYLNSRARNMEAHDNTQYPQEEFEPDYNSDYPDRRI